VPRRPTPATDPAADLARIAGDAADCTACPLYAAATQTVFGEGPVPASLMVVGEQPGDREDKAGHPFVGPAGRILDEALAAATVDRSGIYVTNAVKHFKWEPKGKRRIHQRPNAEEVEACHRWLDAEVEHVDPAVLVAMGATAVRALLGRSDSIRSLRGAVHESRYEIPVVVTVHPSSVVRIHDRADRQEALAALAADLRLAAQHAAA
jgi:uracil-DNA glycosylase family protein